MQTLGWMKAPACVTAVAGMMALAAAVSTGTARAQAAVSSSVETSALVMPEGLGRDGGAGGVMDGGAGAGTNGQARADAPGPNHSTDYALLFVFEDPSLANRNIPRYWIKGAALNVGWNYAHGIGLAMDVAGDTVSNTQPGVGYPAVSLSKISYMFGPRYTYTMRGNGLDFFGEVLLGGAHAFDGQFPSNTGSTTSENGFQSAFGGGADFAVTPRLAVRALEISWVHNTLPNEQSNSRNEMRVGFGIRYRR